MGPATEAQTASCGVRRRLNTMNSSETLRNAEKRKVLSTRARRRVSDRTTPENQPEALRSAQKRLCTTLVQIRSVEEAEERSQSDAPEAEKEEEEAPSCACQRLLRLGQSQQ